MNHRAEMKILRDSRSAGSVKGETGNVLKRMGLFCEEGRYEDIKNHACKKSNIFAKDIAYLDVNLQNSDWGDLHRLIWVCHQLLNQPLAVNFLKSRMQNNTNQFPETRKRQNVKPINLMKCRKETNCKRAHLC